VTVLRRAWNGFWFTPTEPYALAAARIVVALCAFRFLVGSPDRLFRVDFSTPYRAYAERDPRTYFPASFLDWFNVPPPTQTWLTLAFALAFVGSTFLLVGLATRPAAFVMSVTLLYLLAMVNSWGKINHGYHVLGIALLVLPFVRSGDAWSVDALLRRAAPRLRRAMPRRSWQYSWPVTAMQLGYALMFFFAGWNKLRTSGLDWAFSENMRNTLIYQNLLVRDWEGSSDFVKAVVSVDHMWIWYLLGAGGLFTELFFVGIVLFRRWKWVRRALLAAGVGLVVGLDQMMQLPNPVLLIMLLIFVDWNGIHHWVQGQFVRFQIRNAPTGAPVVRRAAPAMAESTALTGAGGSG
jgi:hypothetical protein